MQHWNSISDPILAGPTSLAINMMRAEALLLTILFMAVGVIAIASIDATFFNGAIGNLIDWLHGELNP